MPGPNNAIGLYIEGLRSAKETFQRLPVAVRERVLDATETTTREIVRLAQAKILSSPSVQTRALHDHVQWTLRKSSGLGQAGISSGHTTITEAANFKAGVIGGRKIKIKGILMAGKGGSASTSAGARLVMPSRYAHLVEFGTRKMAAEPFMTPAKEIQAPIHLARVSRAVRDGCSDVATVGGSFQ